MRIEPTTIHDRSTANSFAPTTLAVVIDRVDQSDLAQSMRAEIIRDIKCACAWFEKSPEQMIAHPGAIRLAVRRLSTGKIGVSKKRVSNVLSSLRRGLEIADCKTSRSYLPPLSPSWVTFRDRLEEPFVATTLSRAMRYLSACGVAPHEIADAHMDAFLGALLEEHLLKRPHKVYADSVRAFNKLIRSGKLKADRPLSVQSKSRAYIHSLSLFPESFALDLEDFLRAGANDDPFDLEARATPLKQSTIDAYRDRLLRCASLAVKSGMAPEGISSLAVLTEPDTASQLLKHLIESRGGNTRKFAGILAHTLALVARTHVKWTDAKQRDTTVATLRTFAKKLSSTSVMSTKNRQRLSPLKQDATLAKLYLLPLAMMRPLRSVQRPTAHHALQVQWALVLMLLSFSALRIGSICTLQIDSHLRWSEAGMSGTLTLEFADGDLKNGQPESIPLPPECADLMRLYIEKFRPVIGSAETPYVFTTSRTTGPKSKNLMSLQISRLIHARLGLEVNPHLYRHIVHLVVLKRFPGAFAMVSRVLTHSSLETARRNYSHFAVELSMKAYQKMVLDVAEGGGTEPDTEAGHIYGFDKENATVAANRWENWRADKWPEADRAAWTQACKPGSDFEDGGLAAEWAPRTRENSELAWGRYLEYLRSVGRLNPLQSVGDRIKLENLQGFGRQLWGKLAPFTIVAQFASISLAVKAMAPKADRTDLNRLASRLSYLARGERDVESRLLSPKQTLALGLRLMREAEQLHCQKKMAAVRYRDGLLCALGALAPLRRGNFTAIIIGRHLANEDGQYFLRFEASEMKGRRFFDGSLPSILTNHITRYIEYFRPRFNSTTLDEEYMFLSRSGKPMSGDVMGKKIKAVMHRETGKKFSFHMFRHSAASFIADTAPEKIGVATALLHHQSERTTRDYIKSQKRMAFTDYQEAVKEVASRSRRTKLRSS